MREEMPWGCPEDARRVPGGKLTGESPVFLRAPPGIQQKKLWACPEVLIYKSNMSNLLPRLSGNEDRISQIG